MRVFRRAKAKAQGEAGGGKDLKEPARIKILNEVTREIFESSKSEERGQPHMSRLPKLLERSAGQGTKMTDQEGDTGLSKSLNCQDSVLMQ